MNYRPLAPRRASAGLFAALVLLSAAVQARQASASIAEHEGARVAPWHEPRLIEVKFRDGLSLRARAAGLDDGGSGALAPALDVLATAARGAWSATFSAEPTAIDALRALAETRSGRRMPDLAAHFRLQLDPGVDAGAALDALNALALVERAWPAARPVPPPLPPDFTSLQGYQLAGPTGLGARAAWPLPGGTGGGQAPGGGGLGIRICNVEYAFNASHVDLPAVTLVPPPVGHAPVNPFGSDHHGTAVMGQLFARANGFGITGGVYAAEPHFSFALTTQSPAPNVADAIFRALQHVGSGDILVIEQQTPGPNYNPPACCATATCGPGTDCQFGLVPCEWDLAVYNAIRIAVGLGVTVVEAAGNGSQDLDAPIYASGHAPFLLANDSGAILVGAGAAPGGSTTDRSRLWYSNHGATVDLQGWGELVATLGYGDLYSAGGAHELYTSIFGGTSSATPLVAAAAAQVQSIHRGTTGHPMRPETLRDLLRATGWPQLPGAHPATQIIGPRPDVQAALAALGTLFGCAGDDSWSPGFFGPPGRRDAAVSYDASRGRVLVFGGESAALAKLGDLWAWSTAGPPNGSWTQLTPMTSPGARTQSAMAYDRRRDRVVLFGGRTAGGLSRETWEFDGANWDLRSNTGPLAMEGHAMAYDALRERVVLFASSGTPTDSTTWEWDGTSWSGFPNPPPPNPHPAVRERAGLTWDSDRGRLVLFGGLIPGVGDLGETWERVGTGWSLVATSGPSPRSGAALTYDTGRRRTVLFGGHSSSPFVLLGDAWEWNGLAWRPSLPVALPDARSYHALAFHEARDTELVLGGTTSSQVAVGVYHYRQRGDMPGIPFCFGDGSGAPCPCSNASVPGSCTGCLSSLGLGGKLRSTGRASLASDTVTLIGTDMPNSSALYFQGTLMQSGGAGVAFGDGLRCAGGAIVRLATQVNGAGVSTYPLPGQQPVSQRGLVGAPASRTYQVWYRNAASFCTSATFNLTNGLHIVWGA
ncbi:MAG: S8 family serine peptidase [Planctomycetes bacterium]|nr:S8 family serine peptidase [Planctomycetota bacterium]